MQPLKKLLPSKSVNKLAYKLNTGVLQRNLKFYKKHSGETCYVFGNGESLKSMNLRNFKDKISIGCNNLFLHKEFKELNCKYYQIPPSLFFLPYFKFYNRLQKNPLNKLYRDKIFHFKETNFFTSLANRPFLSAQNIFYEYHFGNKIPDTEHCCLDKSFSFMSSATDAMIGMAIYMGFKKVILVGLDYTFENNTSHHFFEKGKGKGKNQKRYNQFLFEKIQDHIDIQTITIGSYKSDVLKSISYSEYTGDSEKYKENFEIVPEDYLNTLSTIGAYKIS